MMFIIECIQQIMAGLDGQKNGEEAGTKGLNLGAQAIEVKLYEKGSSEAPAQTGKSCVSIENLGLVLYNTHVQNIGWQNKNFYDGQTAGTTGRNLSIEAIKIKVTELGKQGNLEAPFFMKRMYKILVGKEKFQMDRLPEQPEKIKKLKQLKSVCQNS